MNREAYRLANQIKTDFLADGDCLMEGLKKKEMGRYKAAILTEINKEKRTIRRRYTKRMVAACAAVVCLTGVTLFVGVVHAAIQQIRWSIGEALGLSSNLEAYRDVVNTSVSDKGYMLTLQEAVVSEEKLVVNLTLQREDGQPMEDILVPDAMLYVNGKPMMIGAGGGAGFLDEEQKILGVETSYELPDMDLSSENTYRLVFKNLGATDAVRGTWEFAFVADGADLIADTIRIALQKEFTLPDGVTVTLEELTINDLEQRISYQTSDYTDYLMRVIAIEPTGEQIRFETMFYEGKKGSGYMMNQEIIDDGRISKEAEHVTMSLYTVQLPKESGQMSHEYQPLGESFEVELSF